MKLRLFRLFGMALVLLLVADIPSPASAHTFSGPRPPWWPFAIAFPELKVDQSQQLMSGPPAQPVPAPNPAPVVIPPAQQGTYYTVVAGDTLSIIAQRFGVTTVSIVNANDIGNADHIVIGQRLLIPGATSQPTTQSQPAQAAAPTSKTSTRGPTVERQTYAARMAPPSSPFYATTWVTYYGRPNVPILGILGEYNIDTLAVKLRNQAQAYDAANGPQLDVMPAFHLIYGMATVWKGTDGSYLNYMSDDAVKQYIRRAQQEGFGVILDVQIGGLTPLAAIKPALQWLDYDNVHLAIDPEFAMSGGQTIPGQPAGSVTAVQINQVQAAMSNYMQANGIRGRRMLIVHQFLPWMIDDTSGFYGYAGVDLVVCADGFGPPWPKVSKYNLFMDQYVPFTGFKLFYGWDEPLMTERQALGVDPYPGVGYMDVTPNLIIYQ